MKKELSKTNQTQLAGQVLDYEKLLERFFLERELSEKSQDSYRINLKQFWTWLEDSNMDKMFLQKSISKIHLLKYKEDLKRKKLSSRTINSYLVSLRQFFSFLVSYDLYPSNPLANIKSEKIQVGHSKDDLSAKQVIDILDSVETKTVIEKRDYAIIILKFFCALRDIEVTRSKIEDIKSKKGNYVLHIQGKGRSETDKQTEFVILKEPVYKAILDYLTISERSLNSKGFLFIGHGNKSKGELTTKTVQRIITKPLNKLGYKTESITSHSTRHTAISLAIEAGASLEQAQILARHKDPKTTQIYIHNRNRFSENAESKIYELLKKGMDKNKEVGLFKKEEMK
jgi:integrase/recombinase XerD